MNSASEEKRGGDKRRGKRDQGGKDEGREGKMVAGREKERKTRTSVNALNSWDKI